jgi:hypothetical protein
MVRNASSAGFCEILVVKELHDKHLAILKNKGICREFFERSGAGVEPTQPGAARPHRF